MPSSLTERLAQFDAHASRHAVSAPASVAAADDDVVARLVHARSRAALSSPFYESLDSCASSISILSPLSDDCSPPASIDGEPLTHPVPGACRRNEHLAVLIPHNLWKADKLASHCDKYACRVKFSMFERKHHCRKCGGIYCHTCSARKTPLLDTTHLPFLLPPRGFPVSHFAAPNAPVIDARVCDDCYGQVHGYSIPRPRTAPSSPKPLATVPSTSSLSTLSPSTPPDGRPLPLYSSYPRYTFAPPPPVQTLKLDGPLDRYPLKDPSHTCKLAGNGRWEPKRYLPRWDGRMPDGRLRYEAEAEREEEEERIRNANPVILELGGEIRVRRPPGQGQQMHGAPRRSYTLPTF